MTKNKKDTGIHKKGSPNADTESGRISTLSSSGLLRKHPKPRWGFGVRKAMNLDTIEPVPSGDDYRVNPNNPVDCRDAQSNETPRAKAAEVAAGKRMLELLGGIGESRKGDESGRSMVETLGVLVIMGLLAIGGIIGYRYVVDKYLSNELWNNVKWISVQVMTDGSLRGMGTGEEQTVKTFSGDTDLILKRESSIGYSVKAGDLREGVCRQVRRDKPDWVEEVVSNDGAGCQVGEENEVKIYFNGQLNSETTDEDRYRRVRKKRSVWIMTLYAKLRRLIVSTVPVSPAPRGKP